MTKQIEFVNRHEEINEIIQLASRTENNPTLLIEGNGGIGKTRLLEQIPIVLSAIKNSNFLIPEVIDFDDPILRTEGSLELRLIKLLDQKSSNLVLGAMNELWRMEKAGDSPETIRAQKKRNDMLLAGMLSSASLTGRIILRFDTVEKLDSIALIRILNLIKQLSNTFCIFAGRPSIDFRDNMNKILGGNFNLLKLEPFGETASKEYLEKRQEALSTYLGPKLIEILAFLTNGKPIIMDLAVDYVTHEINLSDLLEIDIANIKKYPNFETSIYFKEFETNLVKRITQLHEPMDRLVLVMSRVFPVTKEMISALLSLSLPESEALFEKAKDFVFIKHLSASNELTLHDEMRRLIYENVWKSIDRDEYRRKRDSKLAQKIFEEHERALRTQIKNLEADIEKAESFEIDYKINFLKQSRDAATEKRLEHALYFDLKEGFSEVRQITDKVRGAGKFDLIQRLLDLVEPYQNDNKLDEEQLYTYNFYLARLQKDIGEVEIAEKIFNSLLNENKTNLARKRGILNMLGAINAKLGNWKSALRLQIECRSMLDEKNLELIANVENQIGYIYRNLEDFSKENLSKAQNHYNNALQAARKIEPDLPIYRQINNHDLIASILNNIGYVWGLKQNYRLAHQYCTNAIKIWSREGNEAKIALGETALGIIARDQGNYDHAIRLFNSALSRVSLPSGYETLCRTNFHLGWAQWFKAEAEEGIDLDLLNAAVISLEESKRLAEEYEVNKELPGICHQLASVYWRIGRKTKNAVKCKEARELNETSINLSKKLDNIHYAIDSIVGMAEFDLDEKKEENLNDYIRLLKPYKKFGFPLYFGRIERIAGDFSFLKRDLKTASKKYSKGISLINLHGGYGPYSINDELYLLSQKIDMLDKEEALAMSRYLKNSWHKDPNAQAHVDLIVWCEQRLLDLEIR